MDELKIIAGVLEVDPAIFLRDDKTSIINSGDYSTTGVGSATGIGTVVINEKDLILSFTKSIDGLAEAISAMAKAIEKK